MITDACLAAIPSDDNYAAAALSCGFVAFRGSEALVAAMIMWADEHDLEFICEKVPLAPKDLAIASELLGRLAGRHLGLTAFLEQFAR